MSLHSKRTSLISILSSEHGRMRREQRDIDKRDLQAALKHGTKQKTWGDRWKLEYDGIIFITDASMRSEITAYPSPLALAPITDDMKTDHRKASIVIQHKPDLCVSHTVLVVDNSGSMAKHDIVLYRDRQTAAYTVTALEFVAEQLINKSANNSDVVSLVEFDSSARVVFSREPVSWVLYNKLLSRRDSRNFVTRQNAQVLDGWNGDSNYLPALEEAEKLLDSGEHEACALSLLFLSDGAPTDTKKLGITPAALERRLCKHMENLDQKYDARLNVTMVGFGGALQEFSYLQHMVAAVNNAPGKSKAEFEFSDKMTGAMSSAVSSLVTSISATRVSLTNIGPSQSRIKRVLQAEDDRSGFDICVYTISGHFVFDPSVHQFVHHHGLPYGALRSDNLEAARLRQRNPPPYLALKSSHCGIGAERVAFRCFLFDSKQAKAENRRFGMMVAKETNLVERIEENEDFHKGFCETQSLAAFLADEFNSRLRSFPNFNESKMPRLEFLQCSVLLLNDNDWPGGRRGVLVEKALETDQFPWRKWNDNAGGVDGKAAHVPIDVQFEFDRLHGVGNAALGCIVEGDSDDEESLSDDEETVLESCASMPRGNGFFTSTLCRDSGGVFESESDYLQAFTHFTHWYTNRKVMVCDLQGVFYTDTSPPTFELSDPAIHYASKKGRERVYGRTDKGRKGMKLFHTTHTCSIGCELLRLGKKNKQWRREWHRRWRESYQGEYRFWSA